MLARFSTILSKTSRFVFGMLILYTVISAEIPAGKNDQPVKYDKDARQKILINDNWKFYPSGLEFAQLDDICDRNWEDIHLPHTWNAHDPFDDVDSYRRGISWYRKHLSLKPEWQGKKFFLYFEGANQIATLYVNGVYIGEHKGGYTAFAFDITDHLNWNGEDNLLAVQVNNNHDRHVPPLAVGYALYGGIYRDVWLLLTDPVHFDVQDHASPGFYIRTPEITAEHAKILVEGSIINEGIPDTFSVEGMISDADGKVVLYEKVNIEEKTGQISFRIDFGNILKPILWSPENPYLYNIDLSILHRGKIVDKVNTSFGIRWFSFDPDEGFSLNGKSYKLKGTNRHQDYENLGSALSNEIHYQDLLYIKQMGANFVRLAHYPQDPAVLDAADQLGLLVWEEIPVVNYITREHEFYMNCENMLKEMIYQHYNHPSVIIWGSMNEVLLWSPDGMRIRNHENIEYVNAVRDLAIKLDGIIRREDPSRYSAMAIHSSEDYFIHNISDIPMILGINLYNGWYSGTFGGFSGQLKKIHDDNPEMVIFVSEYGAGSDRRLESTKPERFDFTGRYQILYHESYLRQKKLLNFLGGTAIWNQFDFSQPEIGGSIPHLNQKGMMTWDRKLKDVYFLYKINWVPDPDIYIASRDWNHRIGISDDPVELKLTQELCVYSNSGEVELLIDSQSLGVKNPDEICKLTWMVPFQSGENKITAKSLNNSDIFDELLITCTVIPRNFSNLEDENFPLCINVGSNAQYTGHDGILWLPDKPYMAGNYGFIEGESKMIDRHIVIKGTDDEPIYYTYRKGIKEYKIDLPAGNYAVQLLFLESAFTETDQCIFDVYFNGKQVLEKYAFIQDCSSSMARSETFNLTVSQNENLVVSFVPLKEEPVLSGIKIYKLQ